MSKAYPPDIGAIFRSTAKTTSKITAMPNAGMLLINSETGSSTLSKPFRI